ncbi:MAG: hypothetical protein LC731_04370, partial [Acidobacteria bacterium]|nr:hypothetical protein [Acidobacteriota bacterium]
RQRGKGERTVKNRMMERSDKLTPRDRMMMRVLSHAPWLSFFLVTLPAPIIFFLLYLTSASIEGAVTLIFLTLASLIGGAAFGLLAVILIVLYRNRWRKRIRERLASDGVTADELDWFMNELTSAERQSLKSIEAQNPLLADAYRETLAARLTATRVLTSAKKELLSVERRLNRAALLQGTDTRGLQDELRADHARLERVRNEGAGYLAEVQARLQTIEATASRGASFAETDMALKRLGDLRERMPLALESARMEQQARFEIEEEMRQDKGSRALTGTREE